jgi:hypothetical protein
VVFEGVTTIAAEGHVMFEEPTFRTVALGQAGLY